MLDAIAKDLVSVLPNALLPYLHIIVGIFGIPLELVLSTDAYYFGLFPVMEQITSQSGVDPRAAGYAIVNMLYFSYGVGLPCRIIHTVCGIAALYEK